MILPRCTDNSHRAKIQVIRVSKSNYHRTVPNFNSHHPDNVKTGIIWCLQHREKAISSDSDVYQEEIKSSSENFHRNKYPEGITSATRNFDRTTENDTRKLTTVCLPYVKSLAEKIRKICCPYDIRTLSTSSMTVRKYHRWIKSPIEYCISMQVR